MKSLATPRRAFFAASSIRLIFIVCAVVYLPFLFFSWISNPATNYSGTHDVVDKSFQRKDIIAILQKYYLIPPPPKYTKTDFRRKLEEPKMMQMFTFVSTLLGEKRKGFFIEAGAWDGGELSNTLLFEEKLGWTGLLIEPHPEQFIKLQKRQRKAYISNSCIGIRNYPEKVLIKRPTGIDKQDKNFLSNELVIELSQDKWEHKTEEFEAQCFPLFDFIEALGKQNDVDYLSLDVDGAEFQILKSIPWERVTIKAISVELNGNKKEEVKTYMEAKQYYLVDHLTGPWMHDLLFIYRPFLESYD